MKPLEFVTSIPLVTHDAGTFQLPHTNPRSRLRLWYRRRQAMTLQNGEIKLHSFVLPLTSPNKQRWHVNTISREEAEHFFKLGIPLVDTFRENAMVVGFVYEGAKLHQRRIYDTNLGFSLQVLARWLANREQVKATDINYGGY